MISQAETTRLVDEVLTRRGLKKWAAGLRWWPIAPGVRGWLGLNMARGELAGTVLVNPVIGVQHEELERVVARLLANTSPIAHRNATLAGNIGYLMSPPSYRTWVFAGDPTDQPKAEELADVVIDVGMPAVAPLASLSTLRTTMKTGVFGVHEFMQYTYPVVLLKLGEVEAVRAIVEAFRTTLRGKADAFSVYQLAYAERLQSYLEESQQRGGG